MRIKIFGEHPLPIWDTLFFKKIYYDIKNMHNLKVNFVVPIKYRQSNWPELFTHDPLPECVLNAPHRIVSGVDAWILQTWALLSTSGLPLKVALVERGIPGEISVFHYDHATPAHGVHQTFAIVVRADRPPVRLADMTIEQNPCAHLNSKTHFLPSWPQPGLVPRDFARGTMCTRLAYVGSREYIPAYMKTDRFATKLRTLGIELQHMHKGQWMDYSQVDILVAVRNVPASVLEQKPYAKLVNAWLAGIPIILGSEPAYRALQKSDLDYFEAENEEDVLAAVTCLQKNPQLYRDIVDNAGNRATEFSVNKMAQSWYNILLEAASQKRHFSFPEKCARFCFYFWGKSTNRAWKIVHGWNE